MKRFFSMIIVCMLSMLSLTIPVYADSTADNDSIFIGSGVTRDNNIPTEVWDLSVDGRYDLSGEASGTADLYSLYRFTGVTQMCLSVRNKYSTTLSVTLRKCYTVWGVSFSIPVENFHVVAGNREVRSFNVDDEEEYYLQFSSPCNFDGFVL